MRYNQSYPQVVQSRLDIKLTILESETSAGKFIACARGPGGYSGWAKTGGADVGHKYQWCPVWHHYSHGSPLVADNPASAILPAEELGKYLGCRLKLHG